MINPPKQNESLSKRCITTATANCHYHHHSETHAELFFEVTTAIRGGGGNFCIIVDFTIKAVKVGWDDTNGSGRLLAGVRLVRLDNRATRIIFSSAYTYL